MAGYKVTYNQNHGYIAAVEYTDQTKVKAFKDVGFKVPSSYVGHTAKFVSEGGSEKKEGVVSYYFGTWYTSSVSTASGTKYEPGDAVSKDLYLYALYGNKYGKITMPYPKGSKTGYDFSHWGTNTKWVPGYEYTPRYEYKTSEYYAKYKPHEWTLTVDGNGGKLGWADLPGELFESRELVATYDYTYEAIGWPSTSSRSGYRFKHMSKTPNGDALDKSEVYNIDADSTIYAVWEQLNYTVSFYDRGELKDTKIVIYGEKYGTLPTVQRTGYTFGGWFTDDDEQVNEDTIVSISKDHKLTAKWEPNQYTVHFDTDGGVPEPESITVTYDSQYGSLPSCSKDNYDFIGWYTQDGIKIESNTKVTIPSNHTLYAKWVFRSPLNVKVDGHWKGVDKENSLYVKIEGHWVNIDFSDVYVKQNDSWKKVFK